ncbi:Transcriptional regulator, TfoX/Sxy family [Dehalogenimonas formicexedens]|uniref:Transcriptional regulator, TfoX/Sxy family n=1 Tax=Dehalogenimonas formicexedens TaxID=1839801 RepID=A0A1P8F5J1_9CHLR|nr:TfoX/Sxy family protein [Dehalogenimonas formicexedens]APV43749.1 Transcriptional regulator, TfoX/Sxy family [Dehalogenimonas formicexedens]
MKWEKCSTELSDILAGATAGSPAQKRMMFGCPAYFINGNMVTGVHQSNIILRLNEDDRRSILEEFDEAAPFEPFPGRPMKEYIALPAAVYDDSALLKSWLSRSFRYGASLPPKQPKQKKNKEK